MTINQFTQTDFDNLDYEFNWEHWLGSSESITSASVVSASNSITITDITVNTTNVIAWISGGVLGGQYPIGCIVITSAGRKRRKNLYLNIAEDKPIPMS